MSKEGSLSFATSSIEVKNAGEVETAHCGWKKTELLFCFAAFSITAHPHICEHLRIEISN